MLGDSQEDAFAETILATLRASLGPGAFDSVSPEQTIQQRPASATDVAGQATLIGYAPPLIMPGRHVVSLATIAIPLGEMPTVAQDVLRPAGTEISISYGNESLARWSEFTIHSMVGKGGMGQVFLAGQNALRREVAIKKIIPEHLEKADAIETEASFVSEALVTGYLDHPNIVPIYSLGRDDAGKWFFSMKMVRGIEWRHLLHPGRCKDDASRAQALTRNLDIDDPKRRVEHLEDNLRILFAICNAVAFAHSKNVIHRDLKPENTMVGAFGEVLVMDWGLAVDVSATPLPANSLDRRVQHRSECGMGGTPAYMAPEQFEFDAAGSFNGDRLDRWTDVFLLGGMLHELLTGQPPYVGQSLKDIFKKIKECAPPFFPDDVPSELASICRKALAKNPHERFPDALAFQAALQNFLKHRQAAAIALKADKESATCTIPKLARALVLYDQALELWPENEQYKEAVSDSRDALSKLERKARMTKFALFGAVAGIVLGLAVGFFWIRSESQKTVAALKQQTLLTFEAVVANTETDDDYAHVIRTLDPYLANPELQASEKFLAAQQLRKNASTFIESNRHVADEIKKNAETIQIYLGRNVSMELVRIPEGKFKMGVPPTEVGFTADEGPVHDVELSAFYIGKYDVTQEQYKAVTGTNPSAYNSPKNPVESVSWPETVAFCKQINQRISLMHVRLRLPTEAQWEYACRAGTTTRYSFGDNDSDFGAHGWYKANSHDTEDNYGPRPIGLKKPNPFGLFDIHGNVSNWCADWYDSRYYAKSPARDPQGPAVGEFVKQIKGPGHVMRGGAWDLDPVDARSGARDVKPEDYRSFRRGFRVAMPATLPK